MKVRPSVKRICKNCKVVRRRGVVYVLPETRPVREMFGTLELSAAAAP